MQVAKKRLSVELDDAALQALDEHAREEGESREDAAARLLEEGLRMAKHPSVFFRDGPAGRRAVLIGGPDVWQMAYAFQGDPLDSEEAIERATDAAVDAVEQPRHLMRAAVLYYRDHRDEIDDWIRRNDEEAERAYAAWSREREPQRA